MIIKKFMYNITRFFEPKFFKYSWDRNSLGFQSPYLKVRLTLDDIIPGNFDSKKVDQNEVLQTYHISSKNHPIITCTKNHIWA